MMRSPARCRCLVGVAALMAAGCGRDRPTPAPESTRTAVSADTTADTPVGAPWVSALGPMLLVAADAPDVGMLLVPETPDSAETEAAPFTLLTPAGETSVTRAALVASDSQVCGVAPLLRLRDSLATGWSVGLRGTDVVPLRMDSLATLARRDSAQLVTELARLASTLPMDVGSRFTGLPFAVTRARRFTVDGRVVVAAHLVRRLSQEAMPAEEHTLIVAERATTERGRMTIGFSARSEGTEETVEQYDVLAALQAAGSAWLLLTRDRVSQSVYELLERTPAGWRSRWLRTLAC